MDPIGVTLAILSVITLIGGVFYLYKSLMKECNRQSSPNHS